MESSEAIICEYRRVIADTEHSLDREVTDTGSGSRQGFIRSLADHCLRSEPFCKHSQNGANSWARLGD